MSFSRDRIKASMDIKEVTEEPEFDVAIGEESITIRAIWERQIKTVRLTGILENGEKTSLDIEVSDIAPTPWEVFDVTVITQENK